MLVIGWVDAVHQPGCCNISLCVYEAIVPTDACRGKSFWLLVETIQIITCPWTSKAQDWSPCGSIAVVAIRISLKMMQALMTPNRQGNEHRRMNSHLKDNFIVSYLFQIVQFYVFHTMITYPLLKFFWVFPTIHKTQTMKETWKWQD